MNKGQGKKNKKQQQQAQGQEKEEAKMKETEINQLLQEKLKEYNSLQNQAAEEPEVAALKKEYKKLQKLFHEYSADASVEGQQKEEFQTHLGIIMSELAQRFEEEAYVYRKKLESEKQERDQLVREQHRIQDLKRKYEDNCRELQKNFQQFNELCSQVPAEESKKRQTIKDDFENSVAEIKQKIVTQAAEAEAFEKENDKMRLDLQDMIKSYEEKEKLFWDKVKAKEEEQKNESQKYIQQFEQMQHNAQKAIQDKIVLEASERNITQKKLKLQIYKSKFAEFNHTLEKSYMSLVKIKEEVVKMAFQVKQSEDSYHEILNNTTHGDKMMLQLIRENENTKKKIDQTIKEKEETKKYILKLQEQIKAKKLQEQKLQAEAEQ